LVSIFANEVSDMSTSLCGPIAMESFSNLALSKADSGLLTSAWRRSVQNLIAETDVELILPLVYAAEADLWNRWVDMPDVEGHDAERTAMNSAAVKIYAIKRDVLGWPGL
jgi:hypothetical protein